ncbi:MAG: DUF1592 domain-containing protein [Fuerstiella sp.]|nr:DUF1592 domain-containing protein [Fuerstiella sp.]
MTHQFSFSLVMLRFLAVQLAIVSQAAGHEPTATDSADEKNSAILKAEFSEHVQPLLKKFCVPCHTEEKMEAGVRLDLLNGELEDRRIRLWDGILSQLTDEAMPPEDEAQPTAAQRETLVDWIRQAVIAARSRKAEWNGSVRRLTVPQYRNTLRDVLGLEENLTDVLPPDAVSREGFKNNGQSMVLSPLQLEAYFDIAERALDLCIVDEESRPVIQNFRVDLGAAVNPNPCPDNLILGANSELLANADLLVTELGPTKPFDFTPFVMQKKYRFIEGYQGNSTVRGWRDYDSIYHSVFACMRGNPGYPKGKAYETMPAGLLLRPAIPSAELFGVESTYGPKANFKISLRELPEHGDFRVTVKTAKYDDGLLLDSDTEQSTGASNEITVDDLSQPQTINIKEPGIYQANVFLTPPAQDSIPPDSSRLAEGLVGAWSFDETTETIANREELAGRLEADAKFIDSPFGKAISLDGSDDSVVVSRNDAMNVGTGEFSVSAWIHPRQLQQGGIVCLGKYSWTHGWYLDMPNDQGVLRIETASPDNQSNGTVASRPGVIRVNTWQHVCAVVSRGTNQTRLYVNGYQVGVGTIAPTNLDNPNVDLHIGRIQDSKLFKGEIDEVRIYRRALDVAEIQALLDAGGEFVQPPPAEKPANLALSLGDRRFSGILNSPAFLAVRLPAGSLKISAQYDGPTTPDRIELILLSDADETARRFRTFESRRPRISVHVGLRRDCGSTLATVGRPQVVSSGELADVVFEGAIDDFPSPDVEKNNVNYLAGVREIGVRSEYTDGRDMPRLLIRSVEFEGPLYENWPPVTHRNIFIPSKNKQNPAVYAREIISSFASRAFRRPVTAAEEDPIVAVWQDSFSANGDFQQSIKDALLVVLTAPQFLFLIENSDGPEPEDVGPFELASKLSYFLWNTAPGQRLRQLAAEGVLHQSLESEVDRMIRDPQSQLFVQQFASQWLSLDKFDVVEVDLKRYAKLTRDTKSELRREPVQFLRYLIDNNLPARNLVQSDFIVANEVVANYYGLADRTENGFEFLPIRHEASHLGGLLSQAGILAGLSDGRESNPVKRGAWLARKIIAEPPDDPPPNVPTLPEDDSSQLTLRERLERHRNQKGCVKCHEGIDPWGIPFETFDAGGLFRNDRDVDARSTLPDKTNVRDLNELKTYLANDRIDQVAFSFLKHLSCYAVGRSLTYNEIVFLQDQVVELKAGDYRMRDMIQFVVSSDLFLKK